MQPAGMGWTGRAAATPVDVSGHLYRCGGYRRESQNLQRDVILNVLTRGSISSGCCSSKTGICCSFVRFFAFVNYELISMFHIALLH